MCILMKRAFLREWRVSPWVILFFKVGCWFLSYLLISFVHKKNCDLIPIMDLKEASTTLTKVPTLCRLWFTNLGGLLTALINGLSPTTMLTSFLKYMCFRGQAVHFAKERHNYGGNHVGSLREEMVKLIILFKVMKYSHEPSISGRRKLMN